MSTIVTEMPQPAAPTGQAGMVTEMPQAAAAPTWQAAQPWVAAGVAFLGEMLVARGLCEANPASNSGTAYVHEQFTLEPGRFATAELEVRWDRHVGTGSVQSRPCSRAEWAALLGFVRLGLAGVRTAA